MGRVMMNLEELRKHMDILARVEWDLTPQDAIERFSLKSRSRDTRFQVRDSSEKHYYFCVDNWKEHPKLVLKERSLKESRSIAEIDAPFDLLVASVREHGGGKGVYPLSDSLRGWLGKNL
jgi:hypothetical protein